MIAREHGDVQRKRAGQRETALRISLRIAIEERCRFCKASAARQ